MENISENYKLTIMKELSIEEKAKRYESSLERCRRLYNEAKANEYTSDIEDYEYIFPELAESEDEKTRKEIISYLQLPHPQFVGERKQEKWIAWLEKQGKQKYIDDLTQQEAMDIAVAKCFEQGEQKPANKVEPKFKVKYAGSEYNVLEVKDTAGVTYYGIEDEPNHIDYVQAKNCERVGGYSIKESWSPFPTKPAKFSEQNLPFLDTLDVKEVDEEYNGKAMLHILKRA